MIDPAVLHALYRLADYPVLAALARERTTAIKLDGRACRLIYSEALPRIDWAQVPDQEIAFMRALGVAMTRDELISAVHVHDHEGQPYFVSIDEIPEPWREHFAAALYGCNCPVFDGFERCAYAWDWDVWVRGSWRGRSRGPEWLQP